MDIDVMDINEEEKKFLEYESFDTRYKMQQRAHGFVFYGLNRLQPEQWIKWYETLIEYTESINCPFIRGGCEPGNGGHYVLLKNCKKMMDREINRVKHVILSGESNNYSDIDVYREDPVSCTIGSLFFQELIYLFAHDCSYGTKEGFIDVNLKMLKILKPQYGFYYNIPIVCGAHNYDCCCHCGYLRYLAVDKEDVYFGKAISKWLENFDKYVDMCMRNGRLRELYPINIINTRHMNRYVFSGTTLQEWILADRSRGAIEQVAEELYVWTIDDLHLQQVTEELAQGDILLIINKEKPRRYDYGVREEDQLPLSTVINGRTIEEWALIQLHDKQKRAMKYIEESRLYEENFAAEAPQRRAERLARKEAEAEAKKKRREERERKKAEKEKLMMEKEKRKAEKEKQKVEKENSVH